MIRSAVTISLIPQAKGGPFVFWDDLPGACRKAKSLGFDGVEIFAPSGQAIASANLKSLLGDQNLRLAAVGTGGGWMLHRLTLTGPDSSARTQSRDFIRGIIDAGGAFGAPAIVGSMQGRWDGQTSRDVALGRLREALEDLGRHAKQYNVPLLFEPLNRYETNLINSIDDGLALIQSLGNSNVKLLTDLYHMNIEEADLAGSLKAGGKAIGHVHFADSNRRPMGLGHTDMTRITGALREIGYDGYVSAECLPYPDPDAAAKKTIDSFNRFFRMNAG